jgi:ketosteroid isomerase-like protein
MSRSDVELLRRGWDAFARGDVDGAVEVLDSEVRWHAAGDPDGEGPTVEDALVAAGLTGGS